jgi:hypothetical protein
VKPAFSCMVLPPSDFFAIVLGLAIVIYLLFIKQLL